jgi:hypothetical protein
MKTYWKIGFSLLVQTVLASFALAQNSSAQIPDLTFKGIPFGTSVSSFKAEMPGTVCRNPVDDRTICEGKIDFLDRLSEYSASFSGEGLTLVIVRIYSSESSKDPEKILKHEEDTFKHAIQQFMERLKIPEQFRTNFAIWRLGDQKEQAVILMRCDGKERCILKEEPGVQIMMTNDKFNKRKKDF